MALVAPEHLGGIGLGGLQVGEQGVPAAGGGFGLEGGLNAPWAEDPAQGQRGIGLAGPGQLHGVLDDPVGAPQLGRLLGPQHLGPDVALGRRATKSTPASAMAARLGQETSLKSPTTK